MSKKKIHHPDQAAFPFFTESKPPAKQPIPRKSRICISQILFTFTHGLLLTTVESEPLSRQKHPERLPCEISFLVQSVDTLPEQKRIIRQAVLNKLAGKEHDKASESALNAIDE